MPDVRRRRPVQPPAGAAVAFGPGALVCCLCALACLGLPGCRKSFLNDNDRLRAENLSLQRRVDELEQELADRRAQVAGLLADAAGVDAATLPEGVDPPTLAAVALDHFAGAVDTDADGLPDRLRLYVYPLDQKRRMRPVAGTLVVRALDLSADPPRVLAETTLAPDQLDARYRTGFTGPYYDVPLDLPTWDGPEAVPPAATVVLELTEALTGATVTAQQAVDLRLPTAAPR